MTLELQWIKPGSTKESLAQAYHLLKLIIFIMRQKKSGAIGGKLLGAGGGGFFLFYVDSSKRQRLVKKLEKMNLNIFRFIFDDLGLQTWKTREE